MKSNTLRSFGVFIAFILALTGYSQFKLAQTLPMDPNVKMGKLSNGLTYYIRKNPKPEKKIELRLAVNAGAVLEDNDQRGLAHFMEHMNFNGSKHFPKNELVDYLQKIGVQFGADLNAYTSFDETVYILPITSDDPKIIEQGFTVLEDWAFNNLMDKTEIEKERGVVLEESRLNKGAQQRMSRQYFPVLFNGSKYAERIPIGKDSILKTFKPATLERFYKQWYRPNLMAVIVVGDIDPAEAEKKIRAHFGSFKNPPAAAPRPSIIPIKARAKPEALVLTDEEAPNTILQVFNFVRPAKKVKTWSDLRESIVQDMVNSLINQRLQELTQKENPPFVFGFTGMQSFLRGYETFVSGALLGSNKPDEALNALFAETERARKFGFLPTEIDRVKASMLNDAQNAFAEKDKTLSGQLVQGYLGNFLQGEPAIGAENNYKFLQQVLPGIAQKEINAVAAKMPPSTNAFALITAPAKQKAQLPTNAELLTQMVTASKQQVKPYEERAIAKSLMTTEPMAGKVISETTNEKIGTTDIKLSNGVTVTLKPTKFKNDEIVVDAKRLGGWQRFPLEDKDNARHAAQVVDAMGLGEMNLTDLEKFLTGKTVGVTPYISDYDEGMGGSSSVKDFETFLQMVNLYFTQPRKDQALFNSYVTKNKGQVQSIMANPRNFYSDTMIRILYNSNPWAVYFPNVQEYDNLNLDKIMSIYNQVFGNADGMHFTFVGNLDPVTVKPLLEKYIGSLPAQPTQHTFKDNNLRPVKGVVNANIKKGKEAQSYVTITWTGETNYDRKQNLELRALLDVLNIKVLEKLREELGGMYSGGLSGGVSKRPYVNYRINANIPCGPENVDKLTNALFDLIKSAQEGKLEQKDLDKVKETWKKQYEVSRQENYYWLNNLSQSYIDEYSPEVMLDYEQRVDAITLQDLQKAAQKFLNMNNYVKAVLYPEAANVQAGVIKTF